MISKDKFIIDDSGLDKIKEEIQQEFSHGLAHHGTDVSMIPTYVYGLPDGTESGTYLSLDLGGTNMRVCEVHLSGDRRFSISQEKYKISDELKTGEFTDLFAYMAKSIGHFVATKSHAKQGDRLPLGFTFSFPVDQSAINSGKLIGFTKGFKAANAVGKDVVKTLQHCLDEQKIPVDVVALVNDTVGTLLAHSYQSGGAKIGAIFGTGTNGAYLENLSEILKLDDAAKNSKAGSKMVVNTEWGNVDNARSVLPINEWDDIVDSASINPRRQSFEKLISGMYLGEILRRFLVDMHSKKHFLSQLDKLPDSLNTQYGLDTALMSASLEDVEGAELTQTYKVMTDLGVSKDLIKKEDAELFRDGSKYIGLRAARLSACALAAVIESEVRENETGDINIGLDGSVIEFFPKFEQSMRDALKVLLGHEAEQRIKIGLAKDGSGVGAALCALQAIKQGV